MCIRWRLFGPSQESGEPIGRVVNVYNSGASDLLHVMLDSSTHSSDGAGQSKLAETGASSHYVWVPFVEAIVPDVDMDRGEMMITPPKGLLELNMRSHEKSKKERRQLVRAPSFIVVWILYINSCFMVISVEICFHCVHRRYFI